jgi:hypothetical protein
METLMLMMMSYIVAPLTPLTSSTLSEVILDSMYASPQQGDQAMLYIVISLNYDFSYKLLMSVSSS